MKENEESVQKKRRISKYEYRACVKLIDMLVHVRSMFGNDIDQFLLYLIITLGHLSVPNVASNDNISTRGLNALSLAQITRIPRESVRRKLRQLQASGAIYQGPDGLWRLSTHFGVDALKMELTPFISIGNE